MRSLLHIGTYVVWLDSWKQEMRIRHALTVLMLRHRSSDHMIYHLIREEWIYHILIVRAICLIWQHVSLNSIWVLLSYLLSVLNNIWFHLLSIGVDNMLLSFADSVNRVVLIDVEYLARRLHVFMRAWSLLNLNERLSLPLCCSALRIIDAINLYYWVNLVHIIAKHIFQFVGWLLNCLIDSVNITLLLVLVVFILYYHIHLFVDLNTLITGVLLLWYLLFICVMLLRICFVGFNIFLKYEWDVILLILFLFIWMAGSVLLRLVTRCYIWCHSFSFFLTSGWLGDDAARLVVIFILLLTLDH